MVITAVISVHFSWDVWRGIASDCQWQWAVTDTGAHPINKVNLFSWAQNTKRKTELFSQDDSPFPPKHTSSSNLSITSLVLVEPHISNPFQSYWVLHTLPVFLDSWLTREREQTGILASATVHQEDPLKMTSCGFLIFGYFCCWKDLEMVSYYSINKQTWIYYINILWQVWSFSNYLLKKWSAFGISSQSTLDRCHTHF